MLVTKKLPEELRNLGFRVTLYHVDFFSPADKYFSDAWDAGRSFNIEMMAMEKVFRKLQSVKMPVDDIHVEHFLRGEGFSYQYFNTTDLYIKKKAIHNKVLRINIIKTLNVTAVPSVYVRGEHLINEGLMSTYDEINPEDRYKDVIIDLMNKV